MKLLSVVGTWLIAVLAIWGDKIRSLLFRPKLRVELRNSIGEFTRQTVRWMTPAGLQERATNTRYYHVLVKNVSAARFPIAREAQVVITQLETQGPDGQPQPAFIGVLPLRWAHQEVDPTPSRSVGPERIADLLRILEDGNLGAATLSDRPAGDPALELTPMIYPNNFPHRYTGPTHLWVTVQARSLEADSPPLRMEIAWDGQWETGEAEMARHLHLK